jgi:hypothetical protein
MQLTQIRAVLREAIAKEMASISSRLSAGRAADYAEYRQQVGRIQGLADAIEATDKVFEKFFNDDEGE